MLYMWFVYELLCTIIFLAVLQLSLAPVGTDKFSKLLQNCHNSLAALLEVSTTLP